MSAPLARLTVEIARLVLRVDQVYIDKLDGKITQDHYNRISKQWKKERRQCEEDLIRFQEASHTYINDGVALLLLARDAHKIFEVQDGPSRRIRLNFVLSNCIWKAGVLTADFREPSNCLKKRPDSYHKDCRDQGIMILENRIGWAFGCSIVKACSSGRLTATTTRSGQSPSMRLSSP